jgi:hypothetical protein
VVDARQLFQKNAQSSIKAYLKQQLNCSGPDALRIKRRSRLFNQHPEIADVIKHFIVQADQDGAFNDQKFHEDQRTASVRVNDDAITMHARAGDPLSAAEMKRIFDLAVEAEAHKDFETRRSLHGNDARAHPMPRSGEQRRFDAIYAIFMASVTAAADGKRPEPLVNIGIDATTGLEALAHHGFLDLTNNDHNNNDNLAGSIRRIVVDAHDVVINMGRTQRLFTGKARQAAQLLAVQCGFRGCDVDHITPWINGTIIKPLNTPDPHWAEPEPNKPAA